MAALDHHLECGEEMAALDHHLDNAAVVHCPNMNRDINPCLK